VFLHDQLVVVKVFNEAPGKDQVIFPGWHAGKKIRIKEF
jgi:hypothetical protein